MRDHIALILNGERIEIRNLDPSTTALQWLREQRRLTGTKEGCAEGDCGACTIIVGRLVGGAVRYASLNACITLLPMLDRAAVWTVEGLAEADGTLHPVQQAMVECHGSQCGFCTPGFVMSLEAFRREAMQKSLPISNGDVEAALAGNLCRCTGYGPIVNSARRMLSLPAPTSDERRQAADRAALVAFADLAALVLETKSGVFHAPTSEDELARLAAEHPTASIVSGATDVGLWITKRHRALPIIISTAAVADTAFRSLGPADGGGWWIGAGVNHSDAMAAGLHPALTELWRRFAGRQVRNAGTVGGNIANGSPIGDLAPAFMALGAVLHLRLGDATRTLPLEDFYVDYGRQDRRQGEIVTGVTVAAARRPDDFVVHKVSKRFDDDISTVCGAFNIAVDGEIISAVRIAYGGMAAVPKRARAVEAGLLGKPWSRATIDAALPAVEADFQPISDMRGSASYRLMVARNLLIRTFVERTEPGVETRLVGPEGAFAEPVA